MGEFFHNSDIPDSSFRVGASDTPTIDASQVEFLTSTKAGARFRAPMTEGGAAFSDVAEGGWESNFWVGSLRAREFMISRPLGKGRSLEKFDVS